MDDRDSVIIYSDTREAGTAVAKILSKRCELCEKQLTVADYQLSERVGVERKTISDFLQSIIDGRLFEQLSDLKKTFSRPILLIEGTDDMFELRDIHPNAIRGALASIATDLKIPILWTKSQLETAELLYAIAKREQIQLKRNASLRVKPNFRSINQEQEFLIGGLPKISSVLAKRLLKKFQTPEAVFTAKPEQLQEVDGIGEKLAAKIRKLLTKKYEKWILDSD
jgi:Fanconi anemia group M protein